jgi:hypothetical protein
VAQRARAIERRILDVIHAEAGASLSGERFNRLALDVFAFQYGANEPYRRYCQARSATPHNVRNWHDVPFVPAAAFKEVPLTCFPPEEASLVFTTSGTSQDGRAGTHYLLTSALYDASLLAHFVAALLPDGARLPLYVLAQPPSEAPHSSLSYMLGQVERRLGNGCTYYVDATGLDTAALDRDLALAEAEGTPAMLLGTAFAFVHFLDYCKEHGRRYALPKRSRLMDTGGFKGRSREVSPEELHARYRDVFDIPPQYVVNEYGMTELCSQFYDASLVDHTQRRRRPPRKLAPPWCGFSIVDPETLEPARASEPGVLRFFDLSNLYSVAAVQTEDVGRAVPSTDGEPLGFEVLGRAQGAEARGCSLALDELLSAQTR